MTGVRQSEGRPDAVDTSIVFQGEGVEATEEFRWLFRQEYRSVVWSVHVVLHDYARAEEITQDAFLKLLEHWDKVSTYDRPGAWVRKVAMRLAVKSARREASRLDLERQSIEPEHSPTAHDPDLMAVVAQLPARQRAVVALYYFEDRPVREVAELLGCSTPTVSTHLHRARERLAELLGEGVEADVD